jgi:hypothetical protein
MIGRFVGTHGLVRPGLPLRALSLTRLFYNHHTDDNEDIRFVGQIAEVRLWNVVRTATQISQSWKVPIGQATNLVASWRMTQVRRASIPSSTRPFPTFRHQTDNQMDVLQATTTGPVLDLSGNGRNANLGGTPAFTTYTCTSAGKTSVPHLCC